MKFTISRDSLLAAVQDVMKAISSRTAIPILTGIKIEAKQDSIILTGSDSDISIEATIPHEKNDTVHAEIIESGAAVVRAKYFPEIIRKLPEDHVEIEMDEQMQITIRSGKASFNLNGQDPEEYPQLPALEANKRFELPADILRSLIRQTAFAISTMETRPILTGIQVKMENKELSFTATDSHRLASKIVPVPDESIEFSSVVIPGKSLNELNKIISDTKERIEISMTENQILFRTENVSFLSRLLSGNYPETSRLIPDESETVIYAQTKDLIHTVERASLLAREESNNVIKLSTIGDSVAQITSNSPEIGNAEEEIQLDSIEGESLNISFSAKYLIEALKAIDFETVKIDFTGAMRPFIIRPANEDKILQLILPVRTF